MANFIKLLSYKSLIIKNYFIIKSTTIFSSAFLLVKIDCVKYIIRMSVCVNIVNITIVNMFIKKNKFIKHSLLVKM